MSYRADAVQMIIPKFLLLAPSKEETLNVQPSANGPPAAALAAPAAAAPAADGDREGFFRERGDIGSRGRGDMPALGEALG